MTVIENMTFAPTKVKKMSYDEAYKKSMALLDQVGLKDKENVYPGKLSVDRNKGLPLREPLPWSRR